MNKDVAGGEIAVNYVAAFKICHSITRVTAIETARVTAIETALHCIASGMH